MAGAYSLAEILSQPRCWADCLKELEADRRIGEVGKQFRQRSEWLFIGCGSELLHLRWQLRQAGLRLLVHRRGRFQLPNCCYSRSGLAGATDFCPGADFALRAHLRSLEGRAVLNKRRFRISLSAARQGKNSRSWRLPQFCCRRLTSAAL